MSPTGSYLRTVVEVQPVEVVLAVVLVPVDLPPHRAGDPLHHRHGVKERFSVAVDQAPYLPPDVLHGYHKRG